MLSLIKFIFLISTILTFGFVSVNKLTKIKSIILLIPISISFGIASYIFICHGLSYLIGPQSASIASLFILLLMTLIILFIYRKNIFDLEFEISNKQFKIVYLIALIITILSFFAISRFGSFDKGSHFPISLTIFHNDVYPPRDIYRPDYILLYHFGGDLFAGAIQYICNFDISTSYELMLTICSGTIFLSFFALAWQLTKSFKLSLLCAFCTYFGGGLLWLDAIIRYLWENLPPVGKNWDFLQAFVNLGLHGGITEASSVLTFIPTFGIGYILLISSLILFWQMIEKNKDYIFYLIFLNINLLTLSLVAEWLYMTFWAAIVPMSVIFLLRKKQIKHFALVVILLISSFILYKTLGNVFFLQDELQKIGRMNIFDVRLKENLFTILSWRVLNQSIGGYQPVFCFSWDFFCEFGFSLILFPIIFLYLRETKNLLAASLLSLIIITMPVPVLLDLKLNPAELNRLFCFSNSILVMLVTCSVGTIFKLFFEKKAFLVGYLLVFCLSPFLGLIFAALFTPNIYTDHNFVAKVFESFKDNNFSQLNKYILRMKNRIDYTYGNEISFLRNHSKPKDVAISNLLVAPTYAGVYSIIPSKTSIYWDNLYSFNTTIYETIFSTLDPYLLDELNIKWILITKSFKDKLSKEAIDILNNPLISKAVYKRTKIINGKSDEVEIYHIKNLEKLLNDYKRTTAWLLLDKDAKPIGLTSKELNKIPIFPSLKKTLVYLQSLHKTKPELKKELITAQAYPIEALERKIKTLSQNVVLEKEF